MSLRLVAVSFDALDPAGLAAFWAGMLGREIVEEVSGPLLAGDDTQLGLRFVAAATEKSGPNRLHLHLTSSTLEDQRHTVDTALRLGARHLDVGQLPDEGHVVLADPGGNEFCVIEPGNNFLAGCGFLGEVSCDGTRAVGMFWRDALGWPLVWDQDEQTAVQSPRGGTKVSWVVRRWRPRMGGTGSVSTSLRQTLLRRWRDWSRSVRPSSATGTAPSSSWPTPTATNSRSAPADTRRHRTRWSGLSPTYSDAECVSVRSSAGGSRSRLRTTSRSPTSSATSGRSEACPGNRWTTWRGHGATTNQP